MPPRDGRPWLPVALLFLQVPVTLENLTEGDAGTHRCGIDTSWLPGYMIDLTFRVVVSVTPGPSSVRPTSTPGLHRTLPVPTWGTATLQETPNSSQHPGPSLESHPVEDQASKGAERSLLSSIYFWVVPLLLSLLSAVL
ncbi:CMRF35-like molecule 6 isoform X3 [Halichoerus grypus]